MKRRYFNVKLDTFRPPLLVDSNELNLFFEKHSHIIIIEQEGHNDPSFFIVILLLISSGFCRAQ